MPEIMQYVAGTSLFHRLNPLSKLLMVALVAILAITTRSILPLGLLVAALLLAAAATHLARPLLRQSPAPRLAHGLTIVPDGAHVAGRSDDRFPDPGRRPPDRRNVPGHHGRGRVRVAPLPQVLRDALRVPAPW